MRKLVSALAGSVAAVALVAASAAAQDSVKIGYMATFSGPPGVLGEHNRDGFLLGIEHLGGKLGDLDVEVLEADDQLQPDIGKQIIDRYLQSDRVDFVVGIIFSNVMMAVYEDVVNSETFLISTNAGPSPIAGEACSEYFFSTSWQNDQLHGSAALQAVNDGVGSAFLIAPNYQAGRDAVTGFKREFEGNGTIAGEILTQINQPDYSAEIAQIAASGAEAVFVGSGIFKSSDPAGMAKAVVEATLNYQDPSILAKVSRGLGKAMPGLEIGSLEQTFAQRGW